MTSVQISKAGQSRWLNRLVRVAVVRPRATLAFWLAFVAVATLGIARLEIDTSTNSFLDQADPAWQVYQRSLSHYGGDEFLTVALRAKVARDPAALVRVVELTRSLERIRGVRRVDSLASVPLIRGNDDGDLLLDSPLAAELPASDAEWAQYWRWLEGDRLAPGSLLSEDGRIFALNLILDEHVAGDRASIVAAVDQALRDTGETEAWVTGVPVFRTEVNTHTRDQILVFVPITLALIACVIALAIRGVEAVLVSLAVGAVGSAAGLGAMGALGVTLSLSTTVLPSVLLALGCAYSMHVLTAMHGRKTPGELLEALDVVSAPIALSGLTTVIGFLAMATVRIDSIRELASFGALGVLVATAAVLTLAPAILVLKPLAGGGTPLDAWIRGDVRRRLVGFVVDHSRAIVAAWFVALVVFGFGLSRMEIATDIILWFPRGSDVRESYETVRAQLSGITPINVLVEAVDDDGDVTEPATLRAIDALSNALLARDDIGRSLSLADPLRQLHGVILEDEAAGLPTEPNVVAQYLVLLESMDRMRDVLRADRSGANLLLRADDNTSGGIVAIGEWVDRWWSENGVASATVATTGIMYEFGRAEEEIAHGQIRGLLLAFAAIGTILLVVFRDVRIALLGLLVNLTPLGLIFGFMGLAGLRLDAATACVGSMALGIGVDDTIHVLTAYRDSRLRGASRAEAVDEGMERVLPALLFTTLTVGIGFSVLLLSEFSLVRNLGAVTTAAVWVCLLADVTLLPALLLRWKSGQGRSST